MSRPVCFFQRLPGAGPCDGALIRAHLIPKQLVKRGFPHGVSWHPRLECWVGYAPLEEQEALDRGEGWAHRTLRQMQDDPRCWVPCCGGPTGIGGHHGQFDGLRLRLPRESLPLAVVEYAAELGLSWWLDRTYGPDGALAL